VTVYAVTEGMCFMDSSLPVMIKVGFLRTWNHDRGYGLVEVAGERFPIQTYFLHSRHILDGPNPPPKNALVRFEAGPAREGGKFPSALKAIIVDSKSFGGSR
jgi:hypothetical protein